MMSEQAQPFPFYDKLLESCEPIERFLECEASIDSVLVEVDSSQVDSKCESEVQSAEVAGGSRHVFSSLDQYSVPEGLVERWGRAMGIRVFLLTFIDAECSLF